MPTLNGIYVDEKLYAKLMKVAKGERSNTVQAALRRYFEEGRVPKG